MNVPATLKHSFLLCLFAAAVPLWAIPAPMQVTAATPVSYTHLTLPTKA